ncbi:MAG: NUDIX hydrolase [Myxococcota bacterium]|jgi:8-oxo-dGTP pyrophosphatase MutT (NUDIX family)|nr:NUDIX hydrolase [Myxococcota bacterium]
MADERHEDHLKRWAKSGKSGTPPVNAATVVPIRDTARGIEVLMLKRNSKIAFGGMWVFPGGRVDPEDGPLGSDTDEQETARRAAVREAQEEAGLELTTDSLIAFSHWTPPPTTPRRFLTWFFLAAAPESEIVIDGGEIHEHAWMLPLEALERRNAGKIELAPPTWITLNELTGHADTLSALEATRARVPERFETRIAIEEDGPVAMWKGDAGWPDGDAGRPGARHRLRMRTGQWLYERNLG